MRCPFCQNPCHEETAECTYCGFSLPKLDHFMGTVPAVNRGVSDRSGVLSAKEKNLLQACIDKLERRFPQVGFSVLLDVVKPEIPLHLHAFWIFNRSTVCTKLSTGGVNRDVFLDIDTLGRRSSLMIGYGLEPFMSAKHLNDLLEAARGPLAQGDYAAAIQLLLGNLQDLLHSLHQSLRKTYGAEPVELGIAQNPTVVAGNY
jgi:uncharacterized membrane protein YgcG